MFNASMTIAGFDAELAQAIAGARNRQEDHIELIASGVRLGPRPSSLHALPILRSLGD
jgi:glycine hydroxymethyltransferase